MAAWSDKVVFIGRGDMGTDSDGFSVGVDGPAQEGVYCNRKSIGQTEFFAAKERGFEAQICLEVHAVDYKGEKECDFDGSRRHIYRTFGPRADEIIELYLSDKGGVGGGRTRNQRNR